MLDPERKVAKFTDVTCDMLEGMGAKGVMVDIDNTIVRLVWGFAGTRI